MAFLTLWFHQRQRPHLAALAFGYSQAAIGFLFQYVSPFGLEASRLVSCIGFMLGAGWIAGAILARYGRRVPVLALCVLGGAGVAAFSWFMFVHPDLTARIHGVNFALGGITLVVAAGLRPVWRDGPAELVLFVLSLLSGVNFFARTIVASWADGGYADYDDFYQSAYWTSALLSHAILAILVALTLFGAAALDVVKLLMVESRSDPLSGVLNRRGFAERAAHHFAGSRPTSPVVLVLADLDHFKGVNDLHGHAAGDAVIVAFARILARHGAARHAIVGRMGGEEFAILIPCCDIAAGRLFAESVRTAFALDAPREVAVAGLGLLTCSLGVAERLGDEDLESLMKRADDALMQAKRAGRDRVRAAHAGRAVGVALAATG